VVVGVDAELEEKSDYDVMQIEDRVVSQFEGLSISTQEVRERVDEVLQPLGVETSLLVIRRANSLALLFTCLTLSALMSLRDQWRSRRLRDIVQSLFTFLSGATRTVAIKRLTWPLADYNRRFELLRFLQGELVI